MDEPLTFMRQVGNRLLRPPGMTRAEAETERRMIRAWEEFNRSGDKTLLREIGLLPPS